VIVGVQNHGDFLRTAEDHLSLIRRVDSPWCGPIVDTAGPGVAGRRSGDAGVVAQPAHSAHSATTAIQR